MADRIDRIVRAMETALAVLLICLMLAVVAPVLATAFDLYPLATFSRPWPVVGRAITLNSLLDLQWHLLVITGLLPAGYIWWRDAHMRVDFLYQHYRSPWRARVDPAAGALFALPLFALIIPASLS